MERILKDLIDYGFAKHVDEQLLWFDQEGNLHKIEEGNAGRGNKQIGPTLTNKSGSASQSKMSASGESDDSSFMGDD